MIFENIIFEKDHFPTGEPINSEFENCTFRSCNLTEFDLEGAIFNECRFISCNLSMAKIKGAAFREVEFNECKLLGIAFESVNQAGFSVTFNECFLSHSSFYGMRLKKIIIRDTNLAAVDFTDCDLTGSIMQNCDFNGAIFDNTNLEYSDMRTAKNYSIDPVKNRIRNARFSLPSALALLACFGVNFEE